ncbi:MAG: hypothetical protein JEZ02_21410, partial [Desulfatibacillum sp.]|nr:hypothetical protein [Desulfatibacillum sp.]
MVNWPTALITCACVANLMHERYNAMNKLGRNSFQALCLCFLILSVLLYGGCSESDYLYSPTSSKIMQGWVSVEKPISGATLTLYNIDGEESYQLQKLTTGKLGSFLITVDDIADDFRIVARGGSIDGEAFYDELSADYRNFDEENGTIYINAVTTMISACLDSHPGMTLDESTVAVKVFLGIPDWVDIGRGLHAEGEYFSHGDFMNEAEQNGGVDDFIDLLIAEMDNNPPGFIHPFPGQANGDLNGMGGTLALWLSQGAVSYTGGKVFGWGLSQMGIGFGDDSSQEIENMQTELIKISQKLDAIDGELRKISNELSAQLNQNNYDARLGGDVGTLISNIKSIRDKITIFISNPPADPVILEKHRALIIKLIENKLVGSEYILHNQLVGLPGQTGLLKVWSKVVKSKHRFVSSADSELIQPQFDYFNNMQLWLLELLVEYYHAIDSQETAQVQYAGYSKNNKDSIPTVFSNDVTDQLDIYFTNLEAQEKFLKPPVPEGIYFDRNQNLMIWLPDDYYQTMSMTPDAGLMYIEALRQAKLQGFEDWRFILDSEVDSIFIGWVDSPWEYVRGQGWDIMAEERYIFSLYNKNWNDQLQWYICGGCPFY